MVDPELGWRMEVANYEGAFPHSHSKLMVVDGKAVIASGFNMEFRPMPVDHPSGKGKGDTDLGIQVTGPVAQDARRVFDDLWNGAVQRHCSDFHPAYLVWQATCTDRPASVDHVPEVMRYYLAGGDTTALSMFRSVEHDEADQQVYSALSSAQDSIDILHVSFTFPLLCNLNHFYDLCTFGQAPRYMVELLNAIEENGVEARVLVGVLPFQGIENTVAVDLLNREVEKRGLGDQIEFRFFDGLVHAKTALIDDEFLIVGSQNLHYSAFGENDGLTEYSLGVADPQAIEDFKRMFDYHWERSDR
jgi:phosphatidylserine/phosphatidylglycerophosphate/cardiolipin synthase-like enzyme